MREDRPFPAPYGAPSGPSLTTSGLLAAFLAGARTGSSPDGHIEEAMLLACDHPLAIRLDVAMLVRDEVPPVARAMQVALCRSLAAAGMALLEEESVLAAALSMEMAAPRGYEWNLWARGGDDVRAVLISRAVGEDPGGLRGDPEGWEQVDIDGALEAIERDW